MSSHEHNEPVDDAEDQPDAQLSELVAYLDGELDEHACESVERQLVANPGLRRYAETLDRTWQLLDSLGDAPASGAFTQKTLA
ncbi:MAG: anti-sigma factor family protein, partial [Planctomycetota bacterium]